MTKIDFSNLYSKQGSHLLSNNHHLIISERGKATNKKSNLFLLLVDSKTKKRSYISSIYPIGQTSYSFDYSGVKYVLSLSDEQANIKIA